MNVPKITNSLRSGILDVNYSNVSVPAGES